MRYFSLKYTISILLVYFNIIQYTVCFSQEETGDTNAFIYSASYIADQVRNFSGGIRKGNAYLGQINLSILFNTEYAKLYKGGELYIQFQNSHGATPSADLVGDLQSFTNIENGNYSYLYQAWYKQQLGKISVLGGIHDFNSEFNTSDYGALFINSTFGIQTSISFNVPVSIFPKNSWGFLLKYELNNKFNLQTAIYDGDPGSLETDPYNLEHRLSKEEGFLSCTEIQYVNTNNTDKKGTYKLGFYYMPNEFNHLTDSVATYNGDEGIYLIADQVLFTEKEDSDQGFGVFLQLGWMPKHINHNDKYVGAGFNYKGIFPKRDKDILGFALAYAGISPIIRNAHPIFVSNESLLELTYSIQINENICLQPDFQYILNPGATRYLDNAFIGILRLNVSL